MLRVYLKPKSTFPASLSSITISGAICSALSELFDIEEYLSMDPPFILSSAFPYVEDKERKKIEHFMPKLKLSVNKSGDGAKLYRRSKLLHEIIFRDRVSGRVSEEEIVERIDNKEYRVIDSAIIPKDSIATGTHKNAKHFSQHVDMPGNVINRLTGKSTDFFYRERAFHSSGLYFLADLRMKKEDFMAALSFLADRGISDDISCGNGWFEYSAEEIEWADDKKDLLTTLSTYIPSREELASFGDEVYYDLLKIRSRSADGRVKKPVYAFSEGSVFKNSGKDLYGSIVKALDDAVYFGYAFTVGVKNV